MIISNTFFYTAEIIAPVFLIVFIGVFLRKIKLIDDHFVGMSSRLVFNVTLPALLFINVVQTDFSQIFDARLLGYAIAATLVSFGAVWYLSRFLVDNQNDQGVFTQGACRGNLGIVGLALSINMYGSAGLAAASLILAVLIPLYNVISVVILNLSLHREQGVKWQKILSDIAKNPLILAVVAALPISLMQLQLPAILVVTGEYFGNMTLPLALLGIGGVLNFKQLKSSSLISMASALLKTLLIPLIATLGAFYFGIRGMQLGILYLVFSSPTATVSFTMVRALGGNDKLAANIILLSTFSSMLCLSVGIYILSYYQLL